MTDKKGGCKNCGKPKRDHRKANRGNIYYCRSGGMWQNAAESLPAAPEQKVVYDAWGKAGRLQPVAPVEAKEKERRYPTGGDPKDFCVCGHHEMCHANYADMVRACNQTGCGCRNYRLAVAEPKPTPAQMQCNEQEFRGVLPAVCPKCSCPILGEGSNPTTGVRYFSHLLKSQPDSSSIPDEQTFEDVLRNRAGEYQDMGREHRKNEEYAAACCCEDKASGLYVAIKLYRSWNAAKGQSNGR